MSPLLAKIIAECPRHLADLLIDSANEIDRDFAEAVEVAQEDDKPPKMVLSFSITINTDEHGVNNKLSWTVRRSTESCFKLDDPNQENLPGTDDESSVTISHGGKSVTTDKNSNFRHGGGSMTSSQAKAILKKAGE